MSNRAMTFWQTYRREIYGESQLHLQQEKQCSLAFYAGMLAAFNEMSDLANKAANVEAGALEAKLFLGEVSKAIQRAIRTEATKT